MVDKGVMEVILRQINETGGQGINLPGGGGFVPIGEGESPLRFAMRIARGNYEVSNSKAPEKAESDAARAVREHNERLDDAAAAGVSAKKDVQGSQEGVEGLLEAQIADLRESVAKWRDAVDRGQRYLDGANRNLAFYQRLLNAAEEEEDGMSPTIYTPVGANIHTEEADEPRRSDPVGEPSRSVSPSTESEGSDSLPE